ncbi:MAG: hypothetical protein ACJ789_05445 [Thermomicrobiales bacterium]
MSKAELGEPGRRYGVAQHVRMKTRLRRTGEPRAQTGTTRTRLVPPPITFSADDLQGACERLRFGDGLHHLLARIGGDEARDCRLPRPAHFTSPGFRRRHRATLVVVVLYGLLVVIPGLLISSLGTRLTDRDFVRITDGRELLGSLFLYLVLAPVLWTFYLWQPRLIVDVFAELAQGRVIGAPRHASATPDDYLRGVGASLPRRVGNIGLLRLSRGILLTTLAAAASLATLLVWPPTAPTPFNQLLPESDVFWWRVVPIYFWLVWLPMVFVNVYMLVWICLRQTLMIANIRRLFRLFTVEPIPFHPDRCSGFAPIGSYATNIVRVALIVGGWALILLLSGPATGHGLYVAPYTLFLVVVQVLLTPYLLLGPVWDAHRIMRNARDRALQRIADHIRVSLLASEAARSPIDETEAFPALEVKYRLAEDGYHTWPFGKTALSRVSITAGLTLFGNIAALIYRLYFA